MNDNLRESLSALMDGEATELEVARILANSDCEQLRDTWSRYHLGRAALGGEAGGIGQVPLDFAAKVRGAIDGEPVVASSSAASTVTSAHSKKRDEAQSMGKQSRVGALLRPLTSFAVAASVAAVVVVGGQQLSGGDTVPALVNNGSAPAVGMVGSGAVPMQASFGGQTVSQQRQPTSQQAYQLLAERQLERYFRNHAEQSALNTPQGLVPYARAYWLDQRQQQQQSPQQRVQQ
ncbi:MAG: anti-anti-sigma factor [Gammaproteobacteria bacterium]|nr:MAG: anti-anti-sigma factor [Gammaproteobacteria bacterium]